MAMLVFIHYMHQLCVYSRAVQQSLFFDLLIAKISFDAFECHVSTIPSPDIGLLKKKNTPIEGLARVIKQSGVSVLALVSRVTHSCGAMPAHVKSQYQNADETEN